MDVREEHFSTFEVEGIEFVEVAWFTFILSIWGGGRRGRVRFWRVALAKSIVWKSGFPLRMTIFAWNFDTRDLAWIDIISCTYRYSMHYLVLYLVVLSAMETGNVSCARGGGVMVRATVESSRYSHPCCGRIGGSIYKAEVVYCIRIPWCAQFLLDCLCGLAVLF